MALFKNDSFFKSEERLEKERKQGEDRKLQAIPGPSTPMTYTAEEKQRWHKECAEALPNEKTVDLSEYVPIDDFTAEEHELFLECAEKRRYNWTTSRVDLVLDHRVLLSRFNDIAYYLPKKTRAGVILHYYVCKYEMSAQFRMPPRASFCANTRKKPLNPPINLGNGFSKNGSAKSTQARHLPGLEILRRMKEGLNNEDGSSRLFFSRRAPRAPKDPATPIIKLEVASRARKPTYKVLQDVGEGASPSPQAAAKSKSKKRASE